MALDIPKLLDASVRKHDFGLLNASYSARFI